MAFYVLNCFTSSKSCWYPPPAKQSFFLIKDRRRTMHVFNKPTWIILRVHMWVFHVSHLELLRLNTEMCKQSKPDTQMFFMHLHNVCSITSTPCPSLRAHANTHQHPFFLPPLLSLSLTSWHVNTFFSADIHRASKPASAVSQRKHQQHPPPDRQTWYH